MHAVPRGHLLAGADPARGSSPAQGTEEDLDTLLDICDNILGRSFCALGDGATSPITSSIQYFRDEYIGTTPRRLPVRPGGSSTLFAERSEGAHAMTVTAAKTGDVETCGPGHR